MTDYIKSRNIRDASGSSKEAVCSQLALRILRAATLMSEITEPKRLKYEKLDTHLLAEKLLKKIQAPGSPLSTAIESSELFKMPADIQALPHELYLALKQQSDLH